MDEYAGRSVARGRGLPVIGVLGVLLRARRDGRVMSMAAAMEELRAGIQFRISPAVFDEIRKAAGE